jgi:ABC transporter substrate binding protein
MRAVRAFATFLVTATLGIAPVMAQSFDRPRVGLLSLHYSEIERTGNIGASAFRAGMQAFGYIEGRDFELYERHANGDAARLTSLANELLAERVNVIVAFGTDATHAARQATATIPIVMAGVGDPVRSGFVGGLAHPGSNVTGTALSTEETSIKQLEMLKEAAPRVRRVAVFRRPIGGHDRMMRSFKPCSGLRFQSSSLRRRTISRPGWKRCARPTPKVSSFFPARSWMICVGQSASLRCGTGCPQRDGSLPTRKPASS